LRIVNCGTAANAGTTFIRHPRVTARAISLDQVRIDEFTTTALQLAFPLM